MIAGQDKAKKDEYEEEDANVKQVANVLPIPQLSDGHHWAAEQGLAQSTSRLEDRLLVGQEVDGWVQ